MSTVCVKVTGEKIVMAADSQTTWYDMSLPDYDKRVGTAKLFESGGLTVGLVGYSRDGENLRLFLDSHKLDHFDHMGLLRHMAAFRVWQNDYTALGKADLESELLVTDGKDVFFVAHGTVAAVRDFQAIGSGMYYATTALYLGHGPKEAVEIACKLDPYTGGEVIVKEFYR